MVELTFNKTNLLCGLIALAGIAQFAASVAYAIRACGDGYSITENFLSDLGRTTSPSSTAFNRSVILLGISLIPFFATMPAVLDRGRIAIGLSGVLSAAGLIGIGLTPYDRHFVDHQAALVLWIGPMCFMVLAFAANAKLSGIISFAIPVATCVVLLAVGGYAFASGHSGHVVLQKVLALVAVVWFCLVVVSVSVATIQSFPSRRAVVERQARQYLQVIQRNHRKR